MISFGSSFVIDAIEDGLRREFTDFHRVAQIGTNIG
jgi:hypothetical protein